MSESPTRLWWQPVAAGPVRLYPSRLRGLIAFGQALQSLLSSGVEPQTDASDPASFTTGLLTQQQTPAHEVLIRLPRGLAALGDRPDDEGGPALCVPGDE